MVECEAELVSLASSRESWQIVVVKSARTWHPEKEEEGRLHKAIAVVAGYA